MIASATVADCALPRTPLLVLMLCYLGLIVRLGVQEVRTKTARAKQACAHEREFQARQLFMRYGDHRPECVEHWNVNGGNGGSDGAVDCTCGWADARIDMRAHQIAYDGQRKAAG